MMDKWTIIRTLVLFLAWLNTLLVSKGYTPIPVVSEDTMALFLAFLASVWTWWKDNDVTKKALERKKLVKRMEQNGSDKL